jgi:hypothetical protein
MHTQTDSEHTQEVDLFAAVFGCGRGRGNLPPKGPTVITVDGFELDLITIRGFTHPERIRYRDFTISYNDDLEVSPYADNYRWTISGYANGPTRDISHQEAEQRIADVAATRDIPCIVDSESGTLFIITSTRAYAHALIDIAHDLGLT